MHSIGLLLFILVTSCRNDYYPKPKAYPRHDYPGHTYQTGKPSSCPIEFEYPTFASMETPTGKEPWVNLRFTPFQVILYGGYRAVPSQRIRDDLTENEEIIYKTAPKGSDVRKQVFEPDDRRFTCYFYEISGNTACPVEFILTDHQKQLFRGSLYFSNVPERDSIADILEGLTTDVRHLVESFRFTH